jgi:hypothetical protein
VEATEEHLLQLLLVSLEQLILVAAAAEHVHTQIL